MNQEKDIIVKGWNKLEDDVIIKEVATKGKHVHLCITYLSQRNELSVTEAKNYFLQKVNAYVYRLLSNRQLFKAEHILNNIDHISKYVFYEIAAETKDEELREYIMQHLRKSIDNFDNGEGTTIEANWILFRLLKANINQIVDLLEELDPNFSVLEMETMSFHTFCSKAESYRNKIAVKLFFKNRETTISPILDKYYVWNYLIRNGMDNLLKSWMEINYCVKWQTDDVIVIDIYDDCLFNEALQRLFIKWEIDDKMVSNLAKSKSLCRNDILLNLLAKSGKFIESEQADCIQILRRLFTTETFEQNAKIIESHKFREAITKCLVNNNIFVLLNESFVDLECVRRLADVDECSQKEEIKLFLNLRKLLATDNTKKDLLEISKKTSSYLKHYNKLFYEENPIIQLFEHFLDDDNQEFDGLQTDFKGMPHLNNYLNRLRHSKDDHSDLTMIKMMKVLNKIDLKQLKVELFEDFDNEEKQDDNEVPHFSHANLCAKYSTQIQFSYMHYIKQYRSTYAAYVFFIEQLRDYSKITQIQIMNAAGNVAEVAFNNFQNRELVTHCVAFIEMLGVNTIKVRAFLRCLNTIGYDIDIENKSNEEFLEIFENKIEDNDRLICDLEAATIFCEANNLAFPEKYLKGLIKKNDWFKFTLFVQYLNYPMDQVIELCRNSFENNVGLNLVKAFKYYKSHHESVRRKFSLTQRERKKASINDSISLSTNSSEGELINSRNNENAKFLCPKYDSDLFAVILLCSNEANSHLVKNPTVLDFKQFKQCLREAEKGEHSLQSTFLNLIRNCVKMKWPILSVFAAMINHDCLFYCWLTWLIIATDFDHADQIDNFDDEEEFSRYLIEYCVQNGYIRSLNNSIITFYPHSHIRLLTKYLSETMDYNFDRATTDILREFLQYLNENEDNLIMFKSKNEIIAFCIKLLTLHLANNYQTLSHQQLLLKSLSESEISCFTTLLDFNLLSKAVDVLEFTYIKLNFELFYDNHEEVIGEYEKLCEKLVEGNHHMKAIQIADLLKFPKDNIIYEYWIFNYENDHCLDFAKYEQDLEEYHLNSDLLLNFYVHIANKFEFSDQNKYILLKKGLDLIKKYDLYPSETFDRDKLEYEMVLSYLMCDKNSDALELYHSHYFENIQQHERGVIYNTFPELKDFAGVDELTISNAKLKDKEHILKLDTLINKLLTAGDIVQALRYQAMFDQRPIDLHFIVFCMALAENLVTLYDLSKEERHMLNDDLKKAANRFNKRTLRSNQISQTSASSSPSSRTFYLDVMDTSSGAVFEFEEIPPREKQDVFEAVQGLASKMKNGIDIVQRIVLSYRAAMYLDKDYVELLKVKDFLSLLEEAIDDGCLNKLVVISDIMTCTKMTVDEIADFMSTQIVSAIVKSRFYIFNQNQSSPTSGSKSEDLLWGYNIDKEFHLFLELCPNTTILGNYLLKYCDAFKFYRKLDKSPDRLSESQAEPNDILLSKLKFILKNQVLSLKKQNTIIVALLIKSHDCFVHECSMEGIAHVLQRTKTLNVNLTNAKSWSLIVKLLVGIGRYREMYYCFETLIKNDQFESLLGQFDEQHTKGLKTAIISYLNEHCPENNEFFRLAALHFTMYKELAQMWETESKSTIAKILSENEKKANKNIQSPTNVPRLKCANNILSQLTIAMEGYTHATENYLMDNSLNLAQKSASNAELVAMQMNLVKVANERTHNSDEEKTCISVLNVLSNVILKHYINHDLSVPQALILSRAYNYEIIWIEAIYLHYVTNGEDSYLTDYLNRMPLTDHMIENLVKTFQLESNITRQMEQSISNVIEMVSTVTLKYRLASLLGLKRIISELINNQSLCYLKDTDYGRNDSL